MPLRIDKVQTQFFLVLTIIILGRLFYWSEPYGLSVDESTYLAVAEKWLNGGKIYLDAIDRKPPLLYAIYAAVSYLGGGWNLHAIHVFYILYWVGLCFLAEALFRQLKGGSSRGLVPIVAALVSASFAREFLSCNAEVLMMGPLLGALYFVIRDLKSESKFSYSLWAGVLGSLAILIKQVALIPLGIFWLFWLSQKYKREGLSQAIQSMLLSFGGLALVQGIVALYFLSVGTLRDYFYWVWIQNFGYVQEGQKVSEGRPWLSGILISVLSWPALLYGAAKFFRHLRSGFEGLFADLMMVSGILMLVAGGRLYSHYFIPWSWFFLLVGMMGYQFIRAKKVFWILLIVPFVAQMGTNFFRDQVYEVLKLKSSFTSSNVKRLEEVGRWIRNNSQVSDEIVVWGMASQIYVLSQRQTGTRFVFGDYVCNRAAGHRAGTGGHNEKYLNLYLEDLEKNRPRYFIDTSTASFNDYELFQPIFIPPLKTYLQKYYQEVAKIEGFRILERRL